MRKFVVFLVALLLAVPALSFAGSATSRWDLTMGGYVKFDLVYADKAVGADNRAAGLDSKGTNDQLFDSTSSLTWAGGETRLNWAVKGPDAGGAKTSAFVEGEFRGRTGGTEYGLFAMRHAFFQMIWPQTQLLIGHTWQAWGTIPTLNSLAFSEFHFNKGATRTPQIRLTQKLGSPFTAVFAVQAPYGTENNVTGYSATVPGDNHVKGTPITVSPTSGSNGNTTIEARANGLWPDLVFDFSYATDCLGKIGPFGLKLGIGGFYGKDKYTYNRITDTTSATNNFGHDTVDRYGAGFYWFVPIIPERKGSKAMALNFTGQVYRGKGMSTYLPAELSGAYNRDGGDSLFSTTGSTRTATAVDLQYVMVDGGWVQGTFYFTNSLFTNVIYGAQWNHVSKAFKTAQAKSTSAGPERIQNFAVNLMYDLGPAIRFGIEYDYVTTAYAFTESPTVQNHGNFNSVRVGAYYFF